MSDLSTFLYSLVKKILRKIFFGQTYEYIGVETINQIVNLTIFDFGYMELKVIDYIFQNFTYNQKSIENVDNHGKSDS